MAGAWIEWEGGDMPVSPETIVDVRLGGIDGPFEGKKAGVWQWKEAYRPEDGLGLIVAYRVISEEQ